MYSQQLRECENVTVNSSEGLQHYYTKEAGNTIFVKYMETTFKIKLSKYYHNPECRKKWVLKIDGWINKYCWIKVWLVSLQLSPKTL